MYENASLCTSKLHFLANIADCSVFLSQDPSSTYNLGQCYEHGLGGLPVDSSCAYQLYATAADRGHLDAQFKMACILASGCQGKITVSLF